MSDIKLRCACGEVRGIASDITPSSGIRVICSCSDCQAFARHLESGSTLDEFGGTEIFQASQSQVQIKKGHNKLQCMRLTEKGLLRWYTSCCNTPVANTVNAKMPFVGIIHSFMDVQNREAVLGPIQAYIQTQHAISSPNHPKQAEKFPLGLTARIIFKMMKWKRQGKQKPSVFFGDDDRPVVKPIVLKTTI